MSPGWNQVSSGSLSKIRDDTSLSSTQREFRNNSAAVMDAEELVERHRKLPRVNYALMRQDADELFGEDRVGDDDPWTRTRGWPLRVRSSAHVYVRRPRPLDPAMVVVIAV